MNAFAAALGVLFTDPNLSVDALYRSAGDGEVRPVRVMRRAPDSIGDFGEGRFVTDTLRLDVLIAEVEDLEPGDTFQIGDELLEVRGEPVRDAEHLLWTAEARIL